MFIFYDKNHYIIRVFKKILERLNFWREISSTASEYSNSSQVVCVCAHARTCGCCFIFVIVFGNIYLTYSYFVIYQVRYIFLEGTFLSDLPSRQSRIRTAHSFKQTSNLSQSGILLRNLLLLLEHAYIFYLSQRPPSHLFFHSALCSSGRHLCSCLSSSLYLL